MMDPQSYQTDALTGALQPPQSRSLLPVFLDLGGQRVLVVGGNEMAAAKCRLLVGTGADIVVVDPTPADELRHMAEEGEVRLLHRAFALADLEGARLCYVTLEDASAAEAVVAEACARGVLVNAVDRRLLCDFVTPAIVSRGDMTIAIGTAGAEPALARDLRGRVEAAIPPGYDKLSSFCRDWRAAASVALAGRDLRRRFWDDVLDGPVAEAVLAGNRAEADRLMGALVVRAAAGRLSVPQGQAQLVGAGPGDPDLLTLKGLRALQRADVVLYDKLVGPEVLNLARRDARRIDVGKRCGRHSLTQAVINTLLVRFARQGLRVVRLKGGDPFVFGRGGEEMEAMREAGLTVSVVPGVTASVAAAARLGIPLTHRGVSRSLHLITAHGADGRLPEHNWKALAQVGGTLAVYMGIRTLPQLVDRLAEAGLPLSTPVMAVENATLATQRTIPGTLHSIAERVAETAPDGPTLVLIGQAVALAHLSGPYIDGIPGAAMRA
ncbi:siroheme synthase CysG [Muricoccus pecuniae]|uniref:Uroporphyrin-III C-methyltransferase/precorrin-2 dehydrogenase/sirohydrochlorin ferrochelatase n=1 Tax=Muricoccus pecuniae TaxID=693023 RepID=A0A840YMW4_9PROT|nr:siroheme synthase CysG [Roseomonas pecuniae]MBB5696124.1 uroporphyrin-III C-methyltransferase/precorrin-2 dehydrogenase/sirohydrochlorin ferrochelatase [Roseomonas pecuniae]